LAERIYGIALAAKRRLTILRQPPDYLMEEELFEILRRRLRVKWVYANVAQAPKANPY
jgi:hypothetical protein